MPQHVAAHVQLPPTPHSIRLHRIMSTSEFSDSECSNSESEGPEWLLGFLEGVPPERLLRHQFPSKVGGRPAWLHPLDLPHEDQLRCQVSGGFMRFLLQIYAPITGIDDAFHRTLFVFISPQGNSISKPGGCRAYRCQMPRDNPFYPYHAPKPDDKKPPPIPEGSTIKDYWNVHEYEIGDLTENPATLKLFPEYEIGIQKESSFLCPKPSQTFELPPSKDTHKDDAISNEILRNVEEMLTPEQQSFALFSEQICKDPSQCIRYCFDEDAEPIWPNSKNIPRESDIPNCPRCGAKRKFEFQILPQTIHYLKEDAMDPEAPDWGCIAVYSCSESCSEREIYTGSRAYSEEFVWVQEP